MYNAKILADSTTPGGVRLTTMEITLPRIVLAEFNTHRVFSRNSASSRAIPVKTMLDRVRNHPFIPERFGVAKSGMQATEWLEGPAAAAAVRAWLDGRDRAIETAETLLALRLHKQLANRVLEPYLWHTVIVTATDWSNFFALRDHPDAQPEIQRPARLMREAMEASTPQPVGYGEWHRPLMPDLEELRSIYQTDDLNRISVGRCTRVSYDKHHEGGSPEDDIVRCERLASSGHMSPFEHVATPMNDRLIISNLRGWVPMRKYITNEADFGKRDENQ